MFQLYNQLISVYCSNNSDVYITTNVGVFITILYFKIYRTIPQ